MKEFFHTLVTNCVDLGLGGLLLWTLFLVLILCGVDYLLCKLEVLLVGNAGLAWYDICLYILLLFIFVCGVYYYK